MAILGHIGTVYLAAAANATVWMEVTSCVLAGFGAGLTTLAAQAYGAKNYRLVGLYVQLSIVWSTLFNLPLIGLWMLTTPVLKLINVNHEEAVLGGEYAMWSSLRLIPFTLFLILQCYLQVLGITTPTMVVSFVGLGLNIGLNLLFVHGVGSWKGFGFVGAPISTALTRVIMIILLWLYAFRYRGYHRQTWGGWKLREALNKERSKRYLCTQVLPLSLGLCFEEWQIQIITIFAAQLGRVQVATHNAIISCFFVLTSFMWGTTAAVRVRIAHYLGANAPNRSKRVTRFGLMAATGFGVAVAMFLILSRQVLSKVFSDDPEVWRQASSVQTFVGVTYLALSLFYIAMATLDGQARPVPVAVAFLLGAWGTGVPLAYVFAFELNLKLLGLWYGMAIGYLVVTIIVSVIVLWSDWPALALRARQLAEHTQQMQDQEEQRQDAIVLDVLVQPSDAEQTLPKGSDDALLDVDLDKSTEVQLRESTTNAASPMLREDVSLLTADIVPDSSDGSISLSSPSLSSSSISSTSTPTRF